MQTKLENMMKSSQLRQARKVQSFAERLQVKQSKADQSLRVKNQGKETNTNNELQHHNKLTRLFNSEDRSFMIAQKYLQKDNDVRTRLEEIKRNLATKRT
jgi:hypothetical protein